MAYRTSNENAAEITLQTASGDLTAASTTAAFDVLGKTKVMITLDVTKLTLADSDDEVDFYIQTTYNAGANWADCQNVHFNNSDNGATAVKTIVIDGTLDGPGTVKSITGTDPAAGNEISETVPANTIWNPLSFRGSFVTDATTAAREVTLLTDDGTNITMTIPATFDHDESLTRVYNFIDVGQSLVPTQAITERVIPMPSILLTAGHKISTTVVNLEAGDNWGAPQFKVVEWHDPTALTDGTIRDNVRSYDRPVGSKIRIKTTVTGSSAPTYAFAAYALIYGGGGDR